jgi:hypothetical protein
MNTLPITELHCIGFWENVLTQNGCWLWRKSLQHGYGQWHQRRAHRIAFTCAFGEIPPGLTVDHLCCNKKCVNPYHLDIVDSRTNSVLRAFYSPAGINLRKTHCPKGHAYTAQNSRLYRGARYCRKCDSLRKRRRR